MRNMQARALKKLRQDSEKCARVMLAAGCISLKRGWNFSQKRLVSLLDETQHIWNDCAKDPNVSILMMLEDETGIELKPEETSPSYHDLLYLNGTPAEEVNLSPAAYCYMRIQQTKWTGTMMEASMFLALYHCMDYGFSADMLKRLVEIIREVRGEFRDDYRKMWKSCREECGIDLYEYEREGKIK